MEMFADEAASFFDDDEGTVLCTIGTDSFRARYSEQWVEVNIGRVPFSGIKPTIHAEFADLTGHNNTNITVGIKSYKIVDIQSSGPGMAMAILEVQ